MEKSTKKPFPIEKKKNLGCLSSFFQIFWLENELEVMRSAILSHKTQTLMPV